MRSLKNKSNVTAPSSLYPFGRIKDDTGLNDGTPVDESVYGDIHQFFEKLMNDAGMAANNQPEGLYNGFQLNEAIERIYLSKKVVQIGDWNMDANQFKTITHGLPNYLKIRRISVVILHDNGTSFYPLDVHAVLDGTVAGGVTSIGALGIDIYRVTGGFFDTTNFDSTSYNRGFVTIEYERF